MNTSHLAPFVLCLAGMLVTPACSSSSTSNSPGGKSAEEITEAEPNNGPDMAGMQAVGAFSGTRTVRIKGHLDNGGHDGSKYTGDYDGFTFEVPEAGGAMTTTLDWTGGADVDAFLYDASLNPIAGDNSTVKPVSQKGNLPAGKYAVVVYSKDQAADWTLTLAYAKQVVSGDCIDMATLTATWWQPGSGGILEQIKFYESGKADYEYYNSVSGATPYSGSYELACPNLTATFSGGKSVYKFTMVDGVLVRDGIRSLRCTKPVSSGKCF